MRAFSGELLNVLGHADILSFGAAGDDVLWLRLKPARGRANLRAYECSQAVAVRAALQHSEEALMQEVASQHSSDQREHVLANLQYAADTLVADAIASGRITASANAAPGLASGAPAADVAREEPMAAENDASTVGCGCSQGKNSRAAADKGAKELAEYAAELIKSLVGVIGSLAQQSPNDQQQQEQQQQGEQKEQGGDGSRAQSSSSLAGIESGISEEDLALVRSAVLQSIAEATGVRLTEDDARQASERLRVQQQQRQQLVSKRKRNCAVQ